VQDEIAKNLLDIFGSKQVYLHAAVINIVNFVKGREDIDVRMLGRGRPFILELINPKKTISCKGKIPTLQNMI